jgi:hypothetical protein
MLGMLLVKGGEDRWFGEMRDERFRLGTGRLEEEEKAARSSGWGRGGGFSTAGPMGFAFPVLLSMHM